MYIKAVHTNEESVEILTKTVEKLLEDGGSDAVAKEMLYGIRTAFRLGLAEAYTNAAIGGAIIGIGALIYKGTNKSIKKFIFIKSRKDTVIPGTDYLANKQNEEEA